MPAPKGTLCDVTDAHAPRDPKPPKRAAARAWGGTRRAAFADLGVGLVLLTALWAVGAGIAALTPWLPLPGSVWGMILLFLALERGWIPEVRVRRAAALLVRWLGLLFVPVGVGIAAYGPLVREQWLAIVLAVGLGTVLTLGVAAGAAALLARASDSDTGGER